MSMPLTGYMAAAMGTFNPMQTYSPTNYGGFQTDALASRGFTDLNSGKLTSSQLAALDQVANRDQLFTVQLQDAGQTPEQAKAVADRRSAYETMMNQFEQPGHEVAATDEASSNATAMYDTMKTGNRSGALANGVQDGSINRSEFRALQSYSQQTETLRASSRSDGYTVDERNSIEDRYKKYDAMAAQFKQNPIPDAPAASDDAEGQKLDRFYSATKEDGRGLIDSVDQQAYGRGVVGRTGPVQQDERDDVRLDFDRTKTHRIDDIKPSDPAPHANSLAKILPQLTTATPGQITKDELQAAVHDPKWKGDDARTLAAAYQSYDQLSAPPTPKISGGVDGLMGNGMANILRLQQQMAGVAAAPPPPPPIKFSALDKPKADDPQAMADWKAKTGALGANYDSLNKPLQQQGLYDASGKPDMKSVQQGGIGDCWLMSTMTALKPEQVQNMIKPRDDGSYDVTFPGRKPEVVSPPSDGDQYLGASSNGTWANVLERGSEQALKKDGIPLESGVSTNAMKLFTGTAGVNVKMGNEPAGKDAIDGRDPARVGSILTRAFAENRPVTAASPSEGGFDMRDNPLSSGSHAYAVLGYDSDKKMVTVRNPWGKDETAEGPQANDGVFTMSLAEFQSTFETLAVAQNEPGQKID
jgi:hypothetical protein